MKKALSLTVAAVLVLSALALTSCGGKKQDLTDSKYIGTWKATSLAVAGEDQGDLQGGTYELTLNGDGTGLFHSVAPDGTVEDSEVTWELTDDGFRTKGDTKLKFTEDGDNIKTNIIGVDLIFVREDAETEDAAAEPKVDATKYGYGGDDPAEAAAYKYMSEEVSKNFDPADASIPTVQIVSTDLTNPDDITVAGNFAVDNYKIEGDTLKCVSGGSFPGVMHMDKDYNVTSFDVVEDGGAFEDSAKKLFGDHYEDFMKAYSDDAAKTELRTITVTDYVNYNGLKVTKYQDEGWDPVELKK